MATTKIIPGVLDLNESTSESGLKMPSGTELNRPTAAAGQIRNNTNETSESSASCQEYYNGTAWTKLSNIAIPPPASENFNTVTYTGTGSTQSITGVGFQPDWVWIKNRSNVANHVLIDSNRGRDGVIYSNSSSQEAPSPAGTDLSSFDSDGFTLGTNNNGNINTNGNTYVAWCWKADGGNNTANTDGSITTSIQANSTAGFSVITYTGDGAASSTLGHGLGVAPKFVTIKTLSHTAQWPCYHSGLTNAGYRLVLDNGDGENTTNNPWGSTAPDSSVINLGSSGNVNISGRTFVCYALAEIPGYSKIDSYTGTGASGNTVTVGFEPAWVMIKRLDSTGGWLIFDNKRNTSNPRNNRLEANNDSAEQTGSATKFVDFDSTSFEPQISDSEINASGATYAYIAIAS